MENHANQDMASLIAELDTLAQPGSLSLCIVAKEDNLFLQHHSHLARLTSGNDKIHDVLDLSTALLNRLQARSGSHHVRPHNEADDVFKCGWFTCEVFVANLEHILRCLKQNALDAIIRQYLNLVEAHILHWHIFWQQKRHLDEGWFAEWPNGQRPLNTTWPWNVKPCLLVLWGVCWMFYGSSGYNTNTSRSTRNRRGAAPSQNLLTGRNFGPNSQPPPSTSPSFFSSPLPRQQYDTTPNTPSEAWAGPTPTSAYPNFSWLHPQQAGTRPTRANTGRDSHPPRSHGTNAYDSTVSSNIPVDALQAYSTSLPANPYIIGTSNVSSDLFPASQVEWPYCQGINPEPSPAYAPHYTPWQTTPSAYEQAQVGNFSPAPQRTRSGTGLQPYGPRPQVANPQAPGAGIGSLGFGLGLQDMQNYPSPHSDVSHQTTPSTLSILPGAITSPNMQYMVSPSVAGSSLSGRSSRRSLEPPRNAEGMLYCENPACARQPPLFARKCEWT